MSVRNLHREHRPQTQNQHQENRRNKQQQLKSTAPPSNQPYWNTNTWSDTINEHRKNAIYNDIMNGTFDISKYLGHVPEGHCIYHGCVHVGGIEQCSAMQKIYQKASLRGVQNTRIAIQISNMKPPVRTPQQHQTTFTQQPRTILRNPLPAAATTPRANPSAHFASVQEPLQEISIDNMLDDPGPSQIPDNTTQANNTNLSNNNSSSDYSKTLYYCDNSSITLSTTEQQSPNRTRLLVDSGASHTMINNINLFQTLHTMPSATHVTLADGSSKSPILGHGTVSGLLSGGTPITIENCLYVPGLSDSLLSTKSCSRLQGYSVLTESARTLITTPKHVFFSDDSDSDPLIFFYITPHTIYANRTASSRVTNVLLPHPWTTSNETIPTDPTQTPEMTDKEKEALIKQLPSLPSWFKSNTKVTFKMKKDDVFHQGVLTRVSPYQWTLTYRISNRKVNKITIQTEDLKTLHDSKRLLFGHRNLITKEPQDMSPSSESSTSPAPAIINPSLRVHDKPISSLPKEVSFTIDQPQRNFGFRNISSILPYLKDTSQHNFSISTTDSEPILDIGKHSTVEKSKRNVTPIDLPYKFGDVVYMDVLYGVGTAYAGTQYALYIVNITSRYKSIYPLQNLGEDILTQLKQFTQDFGLIPKRFISDCN